MAIQSEIYLAKGIALDRDYNNVLNYTPQQTLAYVQSKQTAHVTNYSFIEDGIISVGFTYSVCLEANYMAFQNKNYSNRWMFAWIDEVRYVNNGTTEIKYTIDSWSTYFWNLNSDGGCYVIREHTNDDTIGANTIDEGLAIPDVIDENEWTTNIIDTNCYIVVATNWDIYANYISTQYVDEQGHLIDANMSTKDTGGGYNGVSAYNKNVFGQLLCFFDLNESGLTNLGEFIYITNCQGHINDIHDMFIVPKILINSNDLENINVIYSKSGAASAADDNLILMGYEQLDLDSTNWGVSYFRNFECNKSIMYSYSDFTPKNNKCYVYPFNYLQVTNNIGGQNIYRIEDFSDVQNFPAGYLVFQLQLALSIGCSGRLVPVNYKNRAFNYDESISLAKFPTCSWSGDAYTNWLTQNGVNLTGAEKVATTGAAIGLAALSGNIVGAVVSTASQVVSQYGAFKKAQLLPEITGGHNNGDVNFANGNNNFVIMQYRLKTEYMRQIDDYFSRFGYKTLRVKKPNISGRTYWNYLQIGSNENLGVGDVPEKFMNEINRAARKGVTIWHNHANIGNFTLNNTIVS